MSTLLLLTSFWFRHNKLTSVAIIWYAKHTHIAYRPKHNHSLNIYTLTGDFLYLPWVHWIFQCYSLSKTYPYNHMYFRIIMSAWVSCFSCAYEPCSKLNITSCSNRKSYHGNMPQEEAWARFRQTSFFSYWTFYSETTAAVLPFLHKNSFA